jgi:hypothetical protein
VLRIIPALLAALVCAASSSAATSPTYTVSFTGSGVEHQLDNLENIQDSGACDSAQHIDVVANMAWSTSWSGFRANGRIGVGQQPQIDGSTVQGRDVKDACGLDLSLAPAGWVSQKSCSNPLVVSAAPQLGLVKRTATALVLSVAAPSFAVPVGASCSLNIRNDQLTTHVVVSLKKLNALKKRASLVLQVGSARPGPGDVYATTLDCSQPTKPYEGYRTADHCRDDLTWSGTLKITRG